MSTTREERRAQQIAAWERRRAAGTAGWSPERRARFAATMAAKYPRGLTALELRNGELEARDRVLLGRLGRVENRLGEIERVLGRLSLRKADGGHGERTIRRAARGLDAVG